MYILNWYETYQQTCSKESLASLTIKKSAAFDAKSSSRSGSKSLVVGGKKSWRERETESWINYNFHPQCNVGYWGSREEGGK